MTLWRNDIERDAFIETNCRVCWQADRALERVLDQGDGCPHLNRANAGKLPTPWTKRRTAAMGDTYRCSAFEAKPPVSRRGVASADTETMFDIEAADTGFVPVDGWPTAEEFGRTTKKDDHA